MIYNYKNNMHKVQKKKGTIYALITVIIIIIGVQFIGIDSQNKTTSKSIQNNTPISTSNNLNNSDNTSSNISENNCNQITHIGSKCNVNISDQECPKDNTQYKNKLNINVSISQQILFICKNFHITYSSPIATGIPNGSDDTPTGVYLIKNKMRDTYLIGKDYKKFVHYWIPFIQNRIGFHDTPWNNTFGGDTYKKDGSHGCVHVMNTTAKYLYKNLKKGDYVIIKE